MADLTKKQILAIPKILTGKTIKEGLEIAKIPKGTFYRWLRESEPFVEEYNRQRDQLVKNAYTILQLSHEEAARTLTELLNSKDERLRRMVAVDILTLHTRYIEISEVLEQIADIRKRLEDINI